MEQKYSFKYSKDKELFFQLKLTLQFIFLDIALYCDKKCYPRPVITRTISEKMPWSISKTHEEGRALDFRSKVYTKEEIEDLLQYVNKKYAAQFGTGPMGGQLRCLVYETFKDNPENDHFHLQIRIMIP